MSLSPVQHNKPSSWLCVFCWDVGCTYARLFIYLLDPYSIIPVENRWLLLQQMHFSPSQWKRFETRSFLYQIDNWSRWQLFSHNMQPCMSKRWPLWLILIITHCDSAQRSIWTKYHYHNQLVSSLPLALLALPWLRHTEFICPPAGWRDDIMSKP